LANATNSPEESLALGSLLGMIFLFRPVFLQRCCSGLVGIRKSSCEGNQRVRRRHERARDEKQESEYTTKSFLQPQQAGLNFTIAGTPNADFPIMTLIVEPPESLQLVDLGAAALDFAPQSRAKLVHLAIELCGEDSFLFGQLAIKLQPQRRLRLSSLCQLSFQLLSPGGLVLQALKLLCVLSFERLNSVGRHRVGQLGLKRSNERGGIWKRRYESRKGGSRVFEARGPELT
jgi:hypothetical protein